MTYSILFTDLKGERKSIRVKSKSILTALQDFSLDANVGEIIYIQKVHFYKWFWADPETKEVVFIGSCWETSLGRARSKAKSRSYDLHDRLELHIRQESDT